MCEYAALIGIDWSDSKHDICLIDPRTGRREAALLFHSPKSIDEWATALRARFNLRFTIEQKPHVPGSGRPTALFFKLFVVWFVGRPLPGLLGQVSDHNSRPDSTEILYCTSHKGAI
jgi:hypothetical protein